MNAAEICEYALAVKRASSEAALEDGVEILIETNNGVYFFACQSWHPEITRSHKVVKIIYPETNTVGLVEEAVLRLRRMVARDKENRKGLAATWFFSASVNL